ncbi:hypothetical protein [Enterococcus sp. CWB-B31]|nr:hypothetical protein [Enterococcus sp. CWB-B31]
MRFFEDHKEEIDYIEIFWNMMSKLKYRLEKNKKVMGAVYL